jgi:hypothetical protein
MRHNQQPPQILHVSLSDSTLLLPPFYLFFFTYFCSVKATIDPWYFINLHLAPIFLSHNIITIIFKFNKLGILNLYIIYSCWLAVLVLKINKEAKLFIIIKQVSKEKSCKIRGSVSFPWNRVSVYSFSIIFFI